MVLWGRPPPTMQAVLVQSATPHLLPPRPNSLNHLLRNHPFVDYDKALQHLLETFLCAASPPLA